MIGTKFKSSLEQIHLEVILFIVGNLKILLCTLSLKMLRSQQTILGIKEFVKQLHKPGKGDESN